jgi:hypothetical protein
MTAFAASALVHRHQRDYVFPDGITVGDVIDAIAAAGLAGNYVLANQLKIQYALDVCTRCGQQHNDAYDNRATLMQFGFDAFGTVCARCTLAFLAAGTGCRPRNR